MKKIRLKAIVEATATTIRAFPVETAMMLYAFVCVALLIEKVEMENEANCALIPLFFMLAYVLNVLFPCRSKAGGEDSGPKRRKGLRWIYYLCWLPMVPLWWLDPKEWVFSTDYFIAMTICAGGVLCCRMARDNVRFAYESMNYLFNALLALVFSGVAYGLLAAIYASLIYIFNFEWLVIDNYYDHAALFTFVIACPLMFLTFVRENIARNSFPSKFFDILLNFILTPALIVYATILNLYFVKILVQWSLPEGGVAFMVFAFTITAVLVKSCQPLLSKRYYDWFFDRFSYIAMPSLAMFWVGTVYRVSQYGFTSERVYLILCGLVMTGTLAAFARKGRGRYIDMVLATMLLLALFTYIPPISAVNIAVKDQAARLQTYAGRHGMLGPDGRFKPEEELPAYDSLYTDDYDRIYSALSFLENHRDEYDLMNDYGHIEFAEKIGISPWTFRSLYPTYSKSGYDYGMNSYYYSCRRQSFDISGYRKMETVDPWRDNEAAGVYFMAQYRDTLYIAVSSGRVEPDTDTVADSLSSSYPASMLLSVPEGEISGQMEAVEEVVCTEPDLSYYVEPSDRVVLKVSMEDVLDTQLALIGRDRNPLPECQEVRNRPEFFLYRVDDITLMISSMEVYKNEDGSFRVESIRVDYVFIK